MKLYRFINDKLRFKHSTVINDPPVCGALLIDYRADCNEKELNVISAC